jgi:hypothetical protein
MVNLQEACVMCGLCLMPLSRIFFLIPYKGDVYRARQRHRHVQASSIFLVCSFEAVKQSVYLYLTKGVCYELEIHARIPIKHLVNHCTAPKPGSHPQAASHSHPFPRRNAAPMRHS